MTQYWEPGTYYGPGSEVKYEGHTYKIIQPHTSESTWAPSQTPALWGRLNDNDDGYGNPKPHHHEHQHHQQQQQQQQQQQSQDQQYQQPVSQGGYASDQKAEIHHDESQKHWYDLDDNRKKELEMGGGLAAGLGLLGAGYLAYKEHGKNEEEKKAQTWGLQNWVKDAEARTEQFRQYGPQGPATWILNRGTNIPQGAIAAGEEHGKPLYSCRAFYEGSIQPGKASEAFKKGAIIGYAKDEILLDTYEILVGDMRGLRWVEVHGRLNVSSLGLKPVEGGREADGTQLYIAQAPYKDGIHPGKASEKIDGAYIPYGGSERTVKEYRVLCYNT